MLDLLFCARLRVWVYGLAFFPAIMHLRRWYGVVRLDGALGAFCFHYVDSFSMALGGSFGGPVMSCGMVGSCMVTSIVGLDFSSECISTGSRSL